MTTQPSQLNPFYAIQTVGLFGTTVVEGEGPCWGVWRAQVEPFPAPIQSVFWFPPGEEERLALYVREMAGTAADIDTELEAAGLDHLLRDDQTEEP